MSQQKIKRIRGFVVPRHDTAENWDKAKNFIPEKDELIIYDEDSNYKFKRYKIGDGESNVKALAFVPIGYQSSNAMLSCPSDIKIKNILRGGNYNIVGGTDNAVGFKSEKVLSVEIDGNMCKVYFTPESMTVEEYLESSKRLGPVNGVILWLHRKDKNGIQYTVGYHWGEFESVDSDDAGHIVITLDNTITNPYPVDDIGDAFEAGYIGFSNNAVDGTYGLTSRSVTAGRYNRNYGAHSLVVGQHNNLYSNDSIVAGANNRVYDDTQLVVGDHLKGTNHAQAVVGKYNEPDNDAMFIVGNGNTEDSRSNAFVVKEDNTGYLGDKRIITENIGSKSLIFDTYEQLDCWMGNRTSRNLASLASNSSSVTINNDGTFNINNSSLGLYDTYVRVEAQCQKEVDYVFSTNNDSVKLGIMITYMEEDFDGNPTTYTQTQVVSNGHTFYIQTVFVRDFSFYLTSEDETLNVDNVYIQIEEGETPTEYTPSTYVREDGLVKKNLVKGDRLIVSSPVYMEYIWNGFELINDVGQTTDEDGEIFNDYVNNKARSRLSSARGEMTVAGGKGFKIEKIIASKNLFNPWEYTVTENEEYAEIYSDGGINLWVEWNPETDITKLVEYEYTFTLNPGTYTLSIKSDNGSNTDVDYTFKINAEDCNGLITDEEYEHGEYRYHYGTFKLTKASTIYLKLYTQNMLSVCTAWVQLEKDNKATKYETPGTIRYKLKDSVDNIVEGDTYSVRIGDNYDNQGTISGIDTKNNVVIVTNGTFGTTALLNNAYLWLPIDPTNDDTSTKNRKINAGTVYMDAAQYAEGSETYAVKYASHAEGNCSVAAGRYSHAEGNGTYAVFGAHSEGLETKALGQGSHSEGYKTEAKGYASHAEGGDTKANGRYSHTEGFNTTVDGDFSHAEGLDSSASGKASHSEGYKSEASGGNSHAEGNQTKATGDYSHAEGQGSQAIGIASHAEGINTIAEGDYSHAQGNNCRAVGKHSTAMGDNSVANAPDSIASGKSSSTSVDAQFSFVHGQEAKAGVVKGRQSKWSVALGYNVQTDSNHQIALGTYNDLNVRSSGKEPVLMVGYGDSTIRKNNFTVFRNGVARVGADPIDNMDVTTKQYVDGLNNTSKNEVKKYTDDKIKELGIVLSFKGNAYLKNGSLYLSSDGTDEVTFKNGDVYNISDIIDNSSELNGLTVCEGDNVVYIKEEGSTTGYWDVLSAYVDLSGYMPISYRNKILDYIEYKIENNEVIITGCKDEISDVHIIPDTIEGYPVTSIGYEAFTNCNELTSIIIPNSVTIIGERAFAYCNSLTSITIGNNVTSIGANAFNNCASLKSIIIPNNVTSIGYEAFTLCSSLIDVIIPNGVTSIGNGTFNCCSGLTSITIPNSVTSIGSDAFYNCTSLTDIYYEDSEEKWGNITVSEGNEALLNATVHYNQRKVTECYVKEYSKAVPNRFFSFDKESNLSSWMGNTKNLVNVEKYPPKSSDITINNDGTFNINNVVLSAFNNRLTTKCVKDKTYTFSTNNDSVELRILCTFTTMEDENGNTSKYDTTMNVRNGENFYLQRDFLHSFSMYLVTVDEEGNDISLNVNDVWVQIEDGEEATEFAPYFYIREDSITKDDLIEGDLVATSGINGFSYYCYNGTNLDKLIKSSDLDNYYTKDEVVNLINELVSKLSNE